jgi:hypothetical protein
MNQSEPKFIGKRIKVTRSKEAITVEISQSIERWQEAMLFTWLIAWACCGSVFLYYAFSAAARSEQIFFIIASSLWLFFFVRILKVLMWRRMGKEILRLERGQMTLKNAIGKRGKQETFSYANVFKLGLIKRDPTSFLAFLDDSFWIIGGERVGFSYSGQKVRIGKQLQVKDAELLIRVIESAMRDLK